MTTQSEQNFEKQCAYCRKEVEEITKDHVISKCLFPDEYEKINMVIAPCCVECNRGFSKDEEYFRQFLCYFSVEYSKEANTLFHTKIKRSIERRPQFGYKAMSKMELINLYTKNGVYLGKKTKIKITDEDWDRYFNVLDKFIKGLFFNEFKKPIPSNYKIKHVPGECTNKEHLNIVKHMNKWNLDNKKVVSFGVNFIPNTLESIWITIFFNSIFFISFVVSENNYDKFEKNRKQ